MSEPTRCFITRTGCFLPGKPVDNEHIEDYMGRMWGEAKVKKRILAANRIKQRYYAQDHRQRATHDVYAMAVEAIRDCTDGQANGTTYLSAGSTNTPFVGPGLASIIHSRLSDEGILTSPIEINSNSGICSSAAQALVNAHRAIALGGHDKAISVGTEHPSEILKASVVRPHHDWLQMYRDVKKSQWFMTVFLRFMLSDGAGACVLESRPVEAQTNFEVNWTYSQSFANQTPLCMKLENRNLLLTQDIAVLAKHLGPCVREFVGNAMKHNDDQLAHYDCVLPHISSYFFIRELKSVMREQLRDQSGEGQKKLDFWTNLSTVGNTGSASIFIMLDEYSKTIQPKSGTKLMLFVPESGQFNFVLISLTVV